MIRKLIICIAVLVGFCPMAWGTVDDVPNPKTYNADNWYPTLTIYWTVKRKIKSTIYCNNWKTP